MRFCAGVTLYNPEKEIISKINNLLNVFDQIYVYDNSDRKNEWSKIIANDKRVHYYTENNNNGLAISYNYFIEQAILYNFDYLCLLDQDSEFTNENILKIQKFINQEMDPHIILTAPRSYCISSKRNELTNDKEEVEWVINSGSFLNLKLLESNNLRYDESYFLDRIDADFCTNVRKHGLKIVIYNRSILEQELGYSTKNKYPSHNPIRHYYIFRDRLLYNFKYYNFLKGFMISMIQSIKHLSLICLFEDMKVKKIIACYNGFVDYKNKRFKKRLSNI